jgi:hypothetical protein
LEISCLEQRLIADRCFNFLEKELPISMLGVPLEARNGILATSADL